jgi:molybdopterin-guanine dinucleotide biosynthesis protein A
MSIYGLILAGGEGSRLGGVRKADLRIGNRTMLERVMSRLQDTCDKILVATGPGPAGTIKGAVGLSDGEGPHDGPMAGVAAGLRHLEDSGRQDVFLVTVAVDTPFLPPDYVERLIGPIRNGSSAAYSAWGETFYPTNAAWLAADLAKIAPLPSSPKAALADLNAVRVDWSSMEALNPFANSNTLAELLSLSRRSLERE